MTIWRVLGLISCLSSLSLATGDGGQERLETELELSPRSASILVFGFMTIVTAALFSMLPLTYFFGEI